MKKVLLPIAGTMAFIIALGLWAKGSNLVVKPTNQNTTDTKVVSLGDKKINVEIADTETKRQLGLGKRRSLPENQGMLFIFEKKQVFVNFWMKDMQFPIDIIWISNGKVIMIDKNVPIEPGVPDNKLTIYTTTQPIDYVLEVNSGFAQKNNINTGDLVSLPTP